ncbi:hypothetical protein EDB19DRAFT_1677053 [Suillus lakei]|nr:hypothetical protein EDB19DRAFT_1677053 [Suillus lakei]
MWFTNDSPEAQAHAQVTGGHTAKLSHELIASAAAYEAAKAYEKHVQQNGKPANHAKALEMLTKGMDEVDKEKAKHAAHERAKSSLEKHGEF